MPKLNSNAVLQMQELQHSYFNALNEFKNSVSSEHMRLKAKYPNEKLQGLPYLYVFYGTLDKIEPRSLNVKDVFSEFNFWVEMSKKQMLDYLSMIVSVDVLKVDEKLFDYFFGNGKFLVMIRPYDGEGGIVNALTYNSGAYIVKVE